MPPHPHPSYRVRPASSWPSCQPRIPNCHPGVTQHPPALPGQPQAGTHKSVKSSRVSSGVNTSSSPITWGGGQSTRWDGGCPPGWHCAPGRKVPYSCPRLPPLPTGSTTRPWHTCPRRRLFLVGDSWDPLGEEQPQVWIGSQQSEELQFLGPSSLPRFLSPLKTWDQDWDSLPGESQHPAGTSQSGASVGEAQRGHTVTNPTVGPGPQTPVRGEGQQTGIVTTGVQGSGRQGPGRPAHWSSRGAGRCAMGVGGGGTPGGGHENGGRGRRENTSSI